MYIIIDQHCITIIAGRGGGTVGSSVRPQAENWMFESLPRQTRVVKTGNESSTVKRSTISVSVIWVFEDDHYKRMPQVRICMAH